MVARTSSDNVGEWDFQRLKFGLGSVLKKKKKSSDKLSWTVGQGLEMLAGPKPRSPELPPLLPVLWTGRTRSFCPGKCLILPWLIRLRYQFPFVNSDEERPGTFCKGQKLLNVCAVFSRQYL